MDGLDLRTLLIDGAGVARLETDKFYPEYLKYLRQYEITTPLRVSAFFANVIHESSYLARLEENLNYSALGLMRTWRSRYRNHITGKPNDLALSIARKPRLIANYTYANRGGNGDPESGDGWKYRGRGPIQITFKDNYRAIAKDTGLDCLRNPDLLLTPNGGAISSCHYWYMNKINRYADRNDLDGCRDMVNRGRKTTPVGDSLGYKETKRIYDKMLKWFKDNNITEFKLP